MKWIKDNLNKLNDNINELIRIKGSNTGSFEIRDPNDVKKFDDLLDNFVFKEKEILLNILEDMKNDIKSKSNPKKVIPVLMIKKFICNYKIW